MRGTGCGTAAAVPQCRRAVRHAALHTLYSACAGRAGAAVPQGAECLLHRHCGPPPRRYTPAPATISAHLATPRLGAVNAPSPVPLSSTSGPVSNIFPAPPPTVPAAPALRRRVVPAATDARLAFKFCARQLRCAVAVRQGSPEPRAAAFPPPRCAGAAGAAGGGHRRGQPRQGGARGGACSRVRARIYDPALLGRTQRLARPGPRSKSLQCPG
jgi:hypothetical protein